MTMAKKKDEYEVNTPLAGESPYKTPPSNNDLYPNTNYMQDMLDAEKRGDYNTAAYFERMRNEKIGNGLGGGYSPTNFYNYNSKNENKINELRDAFGSYKQFSYNPLEDDAYNHMRNLYSQNAKTASENALGQAAAANGGRVGSNAVIASNLAYQNKMAGLEAEIPQLRDLAYQMYLGDKNDIRTQLNDYMYQENQDYARWNDNLNRRIDNQKYQIDKENYDNNLARQNAMNEIMTFGKVMTPETAKILGVEIGTASSDALNAFRNYGLNYANITGYMPNQNSADFGMDPNQTTLSYRQADLDNAFRDKQFEYNKEIENQNFNLNAANIIANLQAKGIPDAEIRKILGI